MVVDVDVLVATASEFAIGTSGKFRWSPESVRLVRAGFGGGLGLGRLVVL